LIAAELASTAIELLYKRTRVVVVVVVVGLKTFAERVLASVLAFIC
jgi:hypothetical protein